MIDLMPNVGPSAPHRGRLRLRSLLLLGMLLPVVGVVALAGVVVGERWSERQGATELEAVTLDLRNTLEGRGALAEEGILATAIGLATDVGIDPAGVPGFDAASDTDRLDVLRAVVDADLEADPAPEAASLLADRRELQVRLDAGLAGYAEVRAVYTDVRAHVDGRRAEQEAAVEAAADGIELNADVRARLRTLRYSLEAFMEADTRIDRALSILIGEPGPTTAAELLEANGLFSAASAKADPGPGTRAAEAWGRFSADPGAQRIETALATTAALVLGSDPGEALSTVTGETIADGIRWGTLLAGIVDAAAIDLATAAGDGADANLRAVVVRSLGALVLAIVSLALVLATALEVARPARHLEEAARRIQGGDFDLEPVPVEGPRELGATVEAFNDMAATLAAVQDHAVALAEDPDSPIVADPLPGRTGHAMQVALDRLRASVRAAEQRQAELTELATRDGLTGLLNRTAALEAVARELARSRREQVPLAALYVDLDGFKALNDAHGHAAGDEGIRRTARALMASTREADVVARIGGDEFLVVGPVPAGARAEVDALAGRVHAAVSAEAVPVDRGDPVPLRCSVGVALSGAGIDTVDRLIRAADTALYRAKRQGQGPICWYEVSVEPT